MIDAIATNPPRPWVPRPDEQNLALAEALRDLDIQHRRIRLAFADWLGLHGTEFEAFTMIGDQGSVTPGEIASALNLSSGTVTALVDRLERQGLVLRLPNPTSRRSITVRLTEAGENARDGVYDAYMDAVAEMSTAIDANTSQLTTIVKFAATQLAAFVDTLDSRPSREERSA